MGLYERHDVPGQDRACDVSGGAAEGAAAAVASGIFTAGCVEQCWTEAEERDAGLEFGEEEGGGSVGGFKREAADGLGSLSD